MNSIYHEWLVKRNRIFSDIVFRTLAILGCVVVPFIVSFLIAKFAPFFIFGSVVVFALMVWLAVVVFKRTNVEYEYKFLQDELRIDKIMGQSKRKRCATVNVGKVEFMAKEGDPELDSFENLDYYVVDYSSRSDEDNKYVIFYKGEGQYAKVIIEPNDDILKQFKYTAPNRVRI